MGLNNAWKDAYSYHIIVGTVSLDCLDFADFSVGEGWSNETILDNYPQLKKEDIEAVLKYAAETLREEKIYTIS